MNEKEDTIEVTIRLPKHLHEFLTAILKLSRNGEAIEEFCARRLISDIVDPLEGSGLSESFDILNGKDILEAYNLDKLSG